MQTDALLEELNRVNAENKKLTEMLTVACENYNALRSQMMDYMNNNTGGLVTTSNSPSRKRKSESTTNNIIVNNNINNNDGRNAISESSSSDEDSCKKLRREQIKAKISRSYVKTEASDSSLVSTSNKPETLQSTKTESKPIIVL